MNNRLAVIDAVSKQVPVLNQQANQQLQAGNAIQLQQALGGAPQQKNVTKAAQTVAPQVTAQNAQAGLQTAAQTQQAQAGLAQQAIEAQTQQSQNQLATRAIGQQESQTAAQDKQQLRLAREQRASSKKLTQAEIDTANRLSKVGIYQENRLLDLSLKQQQDLSRLGGDVKEQIFDSRLRFEKDEMGRRFSNERQLADFNISRAQNEIELNSHMREMVQAHEKKLQVLEHAHSVILREIDQASQSRDQQLDHESRMRLVKAKKAMEEAIAREKAKAGNTQLIFQGVGMAAGAVIGGMAAGPGGAAMGATAGASVGGGVGTLAYGVAANQGMV